MRTDGWVEALDEALTRVSRTARSPRLHEQMGREADVRLGEHLHLTLARIGAEQPLRVSDLAAQLDVERSTMSRRVSELVRLGLVTRTTEPADHRAAALWLTDTGTAAVAAIQAAWRDTLARLTADWSPQHRTATLASLTHLATALDTLVPEEVSG